ncbi:hypothetical protein PR001_g20946 [Phytophthora rubi]|uniref:Uncharacterized protein n=1 Tax=Phytophthora rubi TaxID=129364 RepID=A0A6A3JDW9_9STRA|nr:hypothetical protein PR001_g20946 [Phytophthora rubi]
MPASFQRNADSDLLSRMKLLPLLSTKTDILELVGRNQLSDTTNTIVMDKMFGARTDVVTVNPAVIGMITSHAATRLLGLEDIFVGLTMEKV